MDQPESFSINGAIECVEALYTNLSKSKRPEFIGEYNEAMVVLETLAKNSDNPNLKVTPNLKGGPK